jgi:hypothetical protein
LNALEIISSTTSGPGQTSRAKGFIEILKGRLK